MKSKFYRLTVSGTTLRVYGFGRSFGAMRLRDLHVMGKRKLIMYVYIYTYMHTYVHAVTYIRTYMHKQQTPETSLKSRARSMGLSDAA